MLKAGLVTDRLNVAVVLTHAMLSPYSVDKLSILNSHLAQSFSLSESLSL